MSEEPRQNKGRELVDRKLIEAPAGRPKAGLLFWFFGGFRCGVLDIKIKNGKNICLMLD